MNTSHSLDADLPRVGERVAGKYRVVKLVGRGGSALVYEVEHVALGTRMAMKVLLSDTPGAFERFRREAQTGGALRHPNVGRVYDTGHLELGWPYLLMDLVTGRTLADRLGDGPMPLPTVVDLGRQILSALGAVHWLGTVHRDLKPENLLLHVEPDGETVVKLVDFGICKLPVDVRNPRITELGMVLGTVQYMAPEQAVGRSVDRRADLYSTGVILYEALTGAIPFDGAELVDVLQAIALGDAASPRVRRPDCPPELEAVIRIAMSVDAEDRFADAGEMARTLDAVAGAHGWPVGRDAWRTPAAVAAVRSVEPGDPDLRDTLPNPMPAVAFALAATPPARPWWLDRTVMMAAATTVLLAAALALALQLPH